MVELKSAKTIAVIGGGSAGFTAARIASGLGARVLFFVGDNGLNVCLFAAGNLFILKVVVRLVPRLAEEVLR